MAVFQFSALNDGQSLAFDPNAYLLKGQATNLHPVVDVLNSTQAIDFSGAAGTFKF